MANRDSTEVNIGTRYPSLMRLEERGAIRRSWGVSENNRRARFYDVTAAGRKHLEREKREWSGWSASCTR